MSVIGVEMISSPGSGSIAATAAWMAAVPDVVQRQNEAPTRPAKRFSKRDTMVRFVQFKTPDSMTWERSASSSSPNERPVALASEGSVILLLLMKDSLKGDIVNDRLRDARERLGLLGLAGEVE